MADQALHGPPGRRPSGRRGREASVAVVGSVAFHALVLGYLALRGLSGAGDRWPAPIGDPFPWWDGPIQVELVPPPSGEGRHIRLSRVVPHDRAHWQEQSAERSQDFHLPEPGRVSTPGARAPDPNPRAGPTGTPGFDAAIPERGPGDRPAPFPGPLAGRARTSALACRNLAGTLTFEEEAVCDERFGLAAVRARTITGTGDPARDARFAAEGQAELDAYEALRAPLKPPTPCEGADLMGRCSAIIMIPLFSRKF